MRKAAILAELPTLSTDERDEIAARLREIERAEQRPMTREEARAVCEQMNRIREQYGPFAEEISSL